MMALMTVTMPCTMAMKQLVIALTTELNWRSVSDVSACDGLDSPGERRIVRRMRRRPLLRCLSLLFGLVGVGIREWIGFDQCDAIGDEDGRWMDGCLMEKKKEREKRVEKPAGREVPNGIPQGMQSRVTPSLKAVTTGLVANNDGDSVEKRHKSIITGSCLES